MVTTYLETRYVDRAKLDELLQALFGQSYKVVVSGDTISVEASRELTEVRPSIPRRFLTWKGLLLNEPNQVEKNSVTRNK
ncbi:hypothetical protein L207DRAFT_591936 [Hyaloscypha variabilis F]|uniref:Uncharacterized protein n=1 Tax=Hyaloscypha variabilis (strain UAMH 11265 / GT02V1 / F) TaxID=1149755 RepID=A0A2J6QXJ7_HYAVF|nr:hypothetical protein L207DRAFT_591936 [Hyaloscypha variabilis F]